MHIKTRVFATFTVLKCAISPIFPICKIHKKLPRIQYFQWFAAFYTPKNTIIKRLHGIQEVSGSIPLISTKKHGFSV